MSLKAEAVKNIISDLELNAFFKRCKRHLEKKPFEICTQAFEIDRICYECDF